MAISLNDALKITEDSSRPFDIKFVSLDQNRKTGGEAITLIDCRRTGASHGMKENDTISVAQNQRPGHPYAIHNFLILEVNGQEIYT